MFHGDKIRRISLYPSTDRTLAFAQTVGKALGISKRLEANTANTATINTKPQPTANASRKKNGTRPCNT